MLQFRYRFNTGYRVAVLLKAAHYGLLKLSSKTAKLLIFIMQNPSTEFLHYNTR